MSFDETADFKTNYIPLDEEHDDQVDNFSPQKKQIAEVLIYMNSFSKKFTIKVLGILGFVYFIFGMHVFTFVYVFLSPEFVSKGNPSESNINPVFLIF